MIIIKNDNNGKKEERRAYSLVPCIRTRRMCGNPKMGLQYEVTSLFVHEHSIIISHAQAKQCKWLLQIKPNWSQIYFGTFKLIWFELGKRHQCPPYKMF